MRWQWQIFYLFLFLYRCLYSVFGHYVVATMTSLGDSRRYQERAPEAFSEYFYLSSAALTDTIGVIFQKLSAGEPLLINFYFQTVGFIGIVMLLQSLEPAVRRKMAVLVMMPSFSLWSSVASKESIVVLAVCLVCTYLVAMYYNRPRIRLRHLFGGYLLMLYKPQYYAGLLFLYSLTYLAKRVHQKAALVLTAGLVSMIPLYIFRDKFDALSFEIMKHFPQNGARSTRQPFWAEQYDVFSKAPEGFYQAFFGPTWAEASTSILHLFAYLESGLIVAILIFYVIRRFPDLPVYNLLLCFFTIFWLMLANYPFGVMNPGSAIRYRTGYVIIIFLMFSFLLSRDLFAGWTSGRSVAKPGRRRRLSP